MRRVCIVWALLAILVPCWWIAHGEITWRESVLSRDGSRTVAAIALCATCALPLRHVAMHWGRLLLPILYFLLLPRWKWLWLIPLILLMIPYFRCGFSAGVATWFRPASALEGVGEAVSRRV